MTETEAIVALVGLAKDRISVIDGEWGCVHDYDVALANEREREEWDDADDDLKINCLMHDDAVALSKIIEALPAEILAALPGTDKENH